MKSELVVTSQARRAFVIDTPIVPIPAPAWLPELAEAMSGRVQEHSPGPAILRLRGRLRDLPGDDFYARWARWFFGEREQRTEFSGK